MANNSESIELEVNGEKYKGGIDYSNGKDLTVKVNIDVSDALKGLKAVQREAKKTARILREVESMENINPTITIVVNAKDNPKKFFDAVKKEMEKLSTEWQ